MGNLVKALKIAANVAEIIVAGSVLIELAEKYGGRLGNFFSSPFLNPSKPYI